MEVITVVIITHRQSRNTVPSVLCYSAQEKNLSARTNARLLIATRADAESFILTLAAVFLLCKEREERLYLQTLSNISHRLAEFYEMINRSEDFIVAKDKRLDVRR